MDNHLLNLTEASKYVGRSEDTMRSAIKRNEVPSIKFRGSYLFSRIVLDLWASGLNLEQIQQALVNSVTKEMIQGYIKESVFNS